MSLKFDNAKKLRKERSKWDPHTPQEFDEMEQEFLKEKLRHQEPTIVGQVRITAGKAKNIMIDIPKKTRPLTDRMKVRIFDILGSDIAKTRVLDLYAGSGSFGLEALSRGAESTVLVDASKHAERILIENVKKTGFLTEAQVVREKVEDYLKKESRDEDTFDIIFMDPPYKLYNKKRLHKMEDVITLASKMLPGIQNPKIKFKGALLMKHPRRYPIDNLELEKLKKYETYDFGLNSISLFIVAN